MNAVMACRTCLATDVRMYNIDTMSLLSKSYLDLTGIVAVSPLDYMCYECTAMLLKFGKFREKCVRANNIVKNILKEHCMVTKYLINNVDRKTNQLISPHTIYRAQVAIENYIPMEDFVESLPTLTDAEKCTLATIKIEPNIELQEIEIKNDFHTDLNVVLLKEKNEHIVNHSGGDIDSDFDSDDCLLKDYITRRHRKRVIKEIKPRKVKKKKRKHKKEKEEQNINDDALDSIVATEIEKKSKHLKKTDLVSEVKKTRPKFDASYFEEYATVVILTPEAAKQEVLLRKESSNYKNCRYKCELCYRGFEAQVTFENHMKKHSSEYGDYECDYCHLRFPEQRFLCKHRLSCHKRKFNCKICPYTCFCTNQAKIHISLHKGKKYPCTECGEIFSMPNSLLMHKRVKHSTECVCELCGSTFATDRGLRSHKMILHRQETNAQKGPLCDKCNVHFATETAWKRHLVLSSKHSVTNGCEYCGETFDAEEGLKIHLRVHARKQMSRADVKLPGECPLCGARLADRGEYRAHTRAAHPDSDAARRLAARERPQCVCELCGKMFRKRCFLVYHQRRHSGERPFACRACAARFPSAGALAAHAAAHAPRSHRCHLCGKLYTFRSALNKHLKAHLGIRPHKCKICDKAFPNPCDVRLHMQYVHYKVPWPKRDRTKRGKPPATTTATTTAPATALYNA